MVKEVLNCWSYLNIFSVEGNGGADQSRSRFQVNTVLRYPGYIALHIDSKHEIFSSLFLICRLIYCVSLCFQFSQHQQRRKFFQICVIYLTFLFSCFSEHLNSWRILRNRKVQQARTTAFEKWLWLSQAGGGISRNVQKLSPLGKQCFGSGPVGYVPVPFFDLPDPDPSLFVPIRIFPSSSKNILCLR